MSAVRFLQRWAVAQRVPGGPLKIVRGHWTRAAALAAARDSARNRTTWNATWTLVVVPTEWAPVARLSSRVRQVLMEKGPQTVAGLEFHTALPPSKLEVVLRELAALGLVVYRNPDADSGRVAGTWRATTSTEQLTWARSNPLRVDHMWRRR